MIEDTEAGPLDQPHGRLLPSGVREVVFSGSGLLRRGYDAYEVDAFLARVESEIAMLLDERAALAAEVERLRARIGGSGTTADERGRGRRSALAPAEGGPERTDSERGPEPRTTGAGQPRAGQEGDGEGRRALIRSYLDGLARQVDEEWDRIDPGRQPELDQPAMDAGTSSAPAAGGGGLRSAVEQPVVADGQRSGDAAPVRHGPSRRDGPDGSGDEPTSAVIAVVSPGDERPAPVAQHEHGPHDAGGAAPAAAVAVAVDAGTRGLEHRPFVAPPAEAEVAHDEADGETGDGPVPAAAGISPAAATAPSTDDERVAGAARSSDDARDAGGTSRVVSAAEDSSAEVSAQLPTPQNRDEAAQAHDGPAVATGDRPATEPAPSSDAVDVRSDGTAAGEADEAPPGLGSDEPPAAVVGEGSATVPTDGPDPAPAARASERTRERKKVTMHSRPRPR